jgi:hypothetical protein
VAGSLSKWGGSTSPTWETGTGSGRRRGGSSRSFGTGGLASGKNRGIWLAGAQRAGGNTLLPKSLRPGAGAVRGAADGAAPFLRSAGGDVLRLVRNGHSRAPGHAAVRRFMWPEGGMAVTSVRASSPRPPLHKILNRRFFRGQTPALGA